MQETQEMWVLSLGQEDPLAIHSTILPEKFHGQRSLGYSPWGWKESDTTEQLSMHDWNILNMEVNGVQNKLGNLGLNGLFQRYMCHACKTSLYSKNDREQIN